MPKPVAEWDEDDVLSLPGGENDTLERKGSRLLDLTIQQVSEDAVRDELAKQLSAFANTGGGQIIYGLTDAGAVDNGGVTRSIRGRQTTKEWLEDLIPGLTDFEIVGFNVYEVAPKTAGSPIAQDKSLYVIDVPDSERAPHQSRRDLRYYVRLSGKSRPAPHRLIEDIRNRARHPSLEVQNLRITNANANRQPNAIGSLKSQFQLHLSLSCDVVNKSKVRASTACLQASATVPVSTIFVDEREWFTRSATKGTVLIELRNSLYPGMSCPLGFPITMSAEVEVLETAQVLRFAGDRPDVRLLITKFADSAPADQQEFNLREIDPDECLGRLIQREVNNIRRYQR